MYTIFDTGATSIYISDLYFADFLARFFEAHKVTNYKAEKGIVTAECKQYTTIEFLMGD